MQIGKRLSPWAINPIEYLSRYQCAINGKYAPMISSSQLACYHPLILDSFHNIFQYLFITERIYSNESCSIHAMQSASIAGVAPNIVNTNKAQTIVLHMLLGSMIYSYLSF